MAGYRCIPGCECNRHKGHGEKKGRKRTDSPGKVARHDRVRYERGRADKYSCIGCGEAARDWAQIHGSDPIDVFAYQPMCRRCHLEYDRGMPISEIMREMIHARFSKGGDAR